MTADLLLDDDPSFNIRISAFKRRQRSCVFDQGSHIDRTLFDDRLTSFKSRIAVAFVEEDIIGRSDRLHPVQIDRHIFTVF